MPSERADPRDPGFSPGTIYFAGMLKRYAFCIPYVFDKVVFDVPCGTGWGASYLFGYKKLYAMDIIQEPLMYCRKNFSDNINLITGNMIHIPIKTNSIDCVLCLDGYEHICLEHQFIFMNEVVRILKKCGTFILTTPIFFDKHLYRNPYHEHEATLDEIHTAVTKYFTTIYEYITDEQSDPAIYLVGNKR